MLMRTSGLVRRTIDEEEAQCAYNRRVLTESVLEEMVYDVESCEHECKLIRLRRQLAAAESSQVEYQERESELIQERQQAYDYAVNVEQEGRAIMSKLNEHLSVVVTELAKKEVMEKELQQVKEQLKLTGQLSKELASAQREIRELRRANDIHASEASVGLQDTTTGESWTSSRYVGPWGLPAAMKQGENVFSPLPDNVMLKLFSFLDEDSMVAISVTDKVLVRRVNVMFGVTTPSSLANSAPPLQLNSDQHRLQHGSHQRAAALVLSGRQKRTRLVSHAVVASFMLIPWAHLEALEGGRNHQAFPRLSTRVKTLEAHLAQVQTEKEDVAARLYSAESVRDFLMEKLKDLEDTLANSMTTTAKKDEQAAVDREIIGFLDATTQEYEVALKEYAHQNNGLRMELAQLREDHTSKTTIIQDMVELLTEEKKELEAQVSIEYTAVPAGASLAAHRVRTNPFAFGTRNVLGAFYSTDSGSDDDKDAEKPKEDAEDDGVEVVIENDLATVGEGDNAPTYPHVLAMPALRRPFFPGVVLPMTITNPEVTRALMALKESGQKYSAGDPLKSGGGEGLVKNLSEIHGVGSFARIDNMLPFDANSVQVLMVSQRRIAIDDIRDEGPPLRVNISNLDNPPYDPKSKLIRAYSNEIVATLGRLSK
ncbi:Lon protease [Phytophthora cactorum]|nr:Lon protease [Phytophthora cactorum]